MGSLKTMSEEAMDLLGELVEVQERVDRLRVGLRRLLDEDERQAP
jgi:hypothetical protein